MPNIKVEVGQIRVFFLKKRLVVSTIAGCENYRLRCSSVNELEVKEEYQIRISNRFATVENLTHCGRVTQICAFNTVKLGTSASSP